MTTLQNLLEEEKQYQFDCFNNTTAWKLGTLAYEKADRRNLPVIISIERMGQILFQVSLPGTNPDNQAWINGKRRIVSHFLHSSLYISRFLDERGKDLKSDYHLDPDTYRLKGGAFPLKIRDTGYIGTLTISGLRDHEDHSFAVEVLKDFLD